MTEEHDRQRRDLTFSQREGKTPLPEPLQPQHLTKKFRNKVWHVVWQDFEAGLGGNGFEEWFENNTRGKYWENFFLSFHMNVEILPHDDDRLIKEPFEGRIFLREKILEAEYDEVLNTIEHMFRCPGKSKEFENELEDCFKESLCIVDRITEPICIFPVTSEEMKQVVSQSLNNISQSELTGAKSHLRKATEELNKKKFADSIRESIHAVEAAAREIDPESSNNFSNALNSLEKNGMLKHPALKEAFKKLYGYTSDTKGIRHSLFDEESSDVGYDEAIFMYGACVSFVDYLVSKQKISE